MSRSHDLLILWGRGESGHLVSPREMEGVEMEELSETTKNQSEKAMENQRFSFSRDRYVHLPNLERRQSIFSARLHCGSLGCPSILLIMMWRVGAELIMMWRVGAELMSILSHYIHYRLWRIYWEKIVSTNKEHLWAAQKARMPLSQSHSSTVQNCTRIV